MKTVKKRSLKFELCSSPDLIPRYLSPEYPAAVVMADVLRASTSIIEALDNGARSIIVVESLREAEDYADRGYLVAAERNACRCDFAQLGNDPTEFSASAVAGREPVFTTSNGTRGIALSLENGAQKVYVGGFVNLSVLTKYFSSHPVSEIIVVAAGWQGRCSVEDCLFAGALAESMDTSGTSPILGDAARMARDLYRSVSHMPSGLSGYIRNTEHYARLANLGAEGIVPYCLTDRLNASLPVVEKHDNIIRCISVDRIPSRL